ncbi:TPA: hypothetical protein JLD81_004111 [Escherichia coli]|nr:hypothetical protein [Escherichia coli]
MSVYPRWRGEHPMAVRSEDTGNRFIPAGAGNTMAMIRCVDAIYGLSPLARGTQPLLMKKEQL